MLRQIRPRIHDFSHAASQNRKLHRTRRARLLHFSSNCITPDCDGREYIEAPRHGAYGVNSEFVKRPRLLLPFLCMFPVLLVAALIRCILCRRLSPVNGRETVRYSRYADAKPYVVYTSSYALLTLLGTYEISCLRRLSGWNMNRSSDEYSRRLVCVGR